MLTLLLRADPPYFLRRFDHETELGTLVFDRDVVSVYGARKAALRRQCQLLQGRILGGLFNTAPKYAFVFHRAELGRHQAENHSLSFRQETQRLEVAGAYVIVLEEIG